MCVRVRSFLHFRLSIMSYNQKGQKKRMVDNTNVLHKGGISSDKHVFQPSGKNGVMKCGKCLDYNKGVRNGTCQKCGSDTNWQFK